MAAAQTTDLFRGTSLELHPCSSLVKGSTLLLPIAFLRCRPQATSVVYILPTACLVTTRLPWGTIGYKLGLLDWLVHADTTKASWPARHLANICLYWGRPIRCTAAVEYIFANSEVKCWNSGCRNYVATQAHLVTINNNNK